MRARGTQATIDVDQVVEPLITRDSEIPDAAVLGGEPIAKKVALRETPLSDVVGEPYTPFGEHLLEAVQQWALAGG